MAEAAFELQYTFTHSDSTHRYEIKWTQVGDSANPPLVFIHGTPWSSVVWHDLASVLQDHFCIYLYNHPGFESSPQPTRQDGDKPDLDPSLSIRAKASAALFKHWNLSQSPHVIAHDNGGLVSLRLFLEHHIKFASLCLMDVVAIGPFGTPFFNLVANNTEVFRKIPTNFMDGFIRSYIRTAAHRPLSKKTEDMLTAQWLETGAQGCERFLQEMLQAHNRIIGDVEKSYPSVGERIPVKVVWGADDSWLPCERAGRLGKILGAKEIVLVQGAGHLIQYDQPSKLAFEVGTWLMKQI